MTARLEELRTEPDPEGADWEWRCRNGTIEGRRPGGEWIVVGNPSPRTIIDGVYIGQSTPARMALWWSLYREPYRRAAGPLAVAFNYLDPWTPEAAARRARLAE